MTDKAARILALLEHHGADFVFSVGQDREAVAELVGLGLAAYAGPCRTAFLSSGDGGDPWRGIYLDEAGDCR